MSKNWFEQNDIRKARITGLSYIVNQQVVI